MPIKITQEENERLETLIREGAKKAVEVLKLFPDSTHGMMTFFAALEGLRTFHPALFGHADRATVVRTLRHWVMAGEPESPGHTPELLLQKYGPNVYREIEEEY
jgi:hypothetical protein